MEGGFITLFVGAFLVILFTDISAPGSRDRAAVCAITASSGLGLLVSGSLRSSPFLMAAGLALIALGLLAQFVTSPSSSRQG
ncbi:hypothetical protein [Deinococcus peraridilitoris]|uniref:Uncharacterized protein n=1 Tax=Deinococcus peraridilitoris (strain DSM 19664 / LMG 22246 / CIP 109416 / KR-200) TaxID=937777 RepID=L0A3I5_DEIPD|nr:hypothetical protein [Deinococcus peraridilitoris]AFZ67737.1 hypothetical protein Deipe_2256 [Deinococcus peraridilitoris DSM 19664]